MTCDRLKERFEAGKPKALNSAIRKGCDWAAGMQGDRSCEPGPRAFVTSADKERAFLARTGVCAPGQRANPTDGQRQRLIDAALACVGVRPSSEFKVCVTDGYGRVRPVPIIEAPIDLTPPPLPPVIVEEPPALPPREVVRPFAELPPPSIETDLPPVLSAVRNLLGERYPFKRVPPDAPAEERRRYAEKRAAIDAFGPGLFDHLERRYRSMDKCDRMLLPRGEVGRGSSVGTLRASRVNDSFRDPMSRVSRDLLSDYEAEA
jgi:hypothetical protein